MLDPSFMEKLSNLVDAYNQHIERASETDIPNIDKELDEIMLKIERYLDRSR